MQSGAKTNSLMKPRKLLPLLIVMLFVIFFPDEGDESFDDDFDKIENSVCLCFPFALLTLYSSFQS